MREREVRRRVGEGSKKACGRGKWEGVWEREVYCTL